MPSIDEIGSGPPAAVRARRRVEGPPQLQTEGRAARRMVPHRDAGEQAPPVASRTRVDSRFRSDVSHLGADLAPTAAHTTVPRATIAVRAQANASQRVLSLIRQEAASPRSARGSPLEARLRRSLVPANRRAAVRGGHLDAHAESFPSSAAAARAAAAAAAAAAASAPLSPKQRRELRACPFAVDADVGPRAASRRVVVPEEVRFRTRGNVHAAKLAESVAAPERPRAKARADNGLQANRETGNDAAPRPQSRAHVAPRNAPTAALLSRPSFTPRAAVPKAHGGYRVRNILQWGATPRPSARLRGFTSTAAAAQASVVAAAAYQRRQGALGFAVGPAAGARAAPAPAKAAGASAVAFGTGVGGGGGLAARRHFGDACSAPRPATAPAPAPTAVAGVGAAEAAARPHGRRIVVGRGADDRRPQAPFDASFGRSPFEPGSARGAHPRSRIAQVPRVTHRVDPATDWMRHD